MDWFNVSEFVPYPIPPPEIEHVHPPADGGFFAGWLVFALILLAAALVWPRPRVVRHSFWCVTAARDVEVRLAGACVESCSAFEDPAAIACNRRCLDPSLRVGWPPTAPGLVHLA